MAGVGGGSGSTQVFASTLTDLMTSLAVIFILLLVVFLKQAHDQGHRAVEEVKDGLSSYLEQQNLPLKQTSDDPLGLTVMVGELHLRFPLGKASLNKESKHFVNTFFKSFADKVCSAGMRRRIDSITVEGNTDQAGEQTPHGVRKNIEISQQRAYAVLEQGLTSVENDSNLYNCLVTLASASGRGSANPVFVNGAYNADQSRRVEIKIRVRPNSNVVPAPPPLPVSAPPRRR